MNSKLVVAGILAAVISGAAVAEDWEMAMFKESEPDGPQLTRCYYRSAYGYEFSIVVRRRPCPGKVEVNPESGRVREK